mmetsp:Transcript_14165/g.34942  ORF Transcript_14165/g.34942 Transcript_14165/m.34942 type:complete len:276 (-) Transcript_14165:891-1718(-)
MAASDSALTPPVPGAAPMGAPPIMPGWEARGEGGELNSGLAAPPADMAPGIMPDMPGPAGGVMVVRGEAMPMPPIMPGAAPPFFRVCMRAISCTNSMRLRPWGGTGPEIQPSRPADSTSSRMGPAGCQPYAHTRMPMDLRRPTRPTGERLCRKSGASSTKSTKLVPPRLRPCCASCTAMSGPTPGYTSKGAGSEANCWRKKSTVDMSGSARMTRPGSRVGMPPIMPMPPMVPMPMPPMPPMFMPCMPMPIPCMPMPIMPIWPMPYPIWPMGPPMP